MRFTQSTIIKINALFDYLLFVVVNFLAYGVCMLEVEMSAMTEVEVVVTSAACIGIVLKDYCCT